MNRITQSMFAKLQSLSSARRQVVFVAGAVLSVGLLTLLTAHKMYTPKSFSQGPQAVESLPLENPATSNDVNALEQELARPPQLGSPALNKSAAQSLSYGDFRPQPRLAYAADLGVITKDFVHARSSMEEILDRHRGYAARLRMIGLPAGSSLSATLKVPASEYAPTLADLKSIGDVQQDEESADEVVQQRGDLEARLQNARNNARRLELLLKESTDKSIDVDYVQRQLTALRGEIANLELQRRNVDNRVVFSNIRFSLREVRDTPAETVSAQLRSAAASGLSDAIRGLSALLLVLVSYGPSLILWAAVLFFPARYLWRRSRMTTARETA